MSDWSASAISNYSHKDLPWVVSKEGDEIDYELAFYREAPYSVRNYGNEIEEKWPLMNLLNIKKIWKVFWKKYRTLNDDIDLCNIHKLRLFTRIKITQKLMIVISLFMVVIQQLTVAFVRIEGELFFVKGKIWSLIFCFLKQETGRRPMPVGLRPDLSLFLFV